MIHTYHSETESRGCVVNTPASFSGDPGFKSQPAILTEGFCGFSQSLPYRDNTLS
jgi:hypothetical protein